MSDLSVYLSGEIHTDWRERIEAGAAAAGLDIEFTAPVTDHGSSDDCGVAILGQENSGFWKDHKGAKINAIRTRTALEMADLVVVKFGEKYKQWNAAFDAGYAAALGTPIIVIHPPEFTHALKEIDGAGFQRLHRHREGPMAGEHDDRNAFESGVALHDAKELQAVHPRHVEVQQDQVKLLGLRQHRFGLGIRRQYVYIDTII